MLSNGWERVEIAKNNSDNRDKSTYLSTRSRVTERVCKSTPIKSYCRNPHRMPDRLMYDTGAAIGENRSKEQKVTVTKLTSELTSMSTKNRITTRVARATPIPSNCRDCHRMPRRLMHLTGKEKRENRSEDQKMNATTQTNALTSPQKIALRRVSPELRQFQAISVIAIECRVDWCIK